MSTLFRISLSKTATDEDLSSWWCKYECEMCWRTKSHLSSALCQQKSWTSCYKRPTQNLRSLSHFLKIDRIRICQSRHIFSLSQSISLHCFRDYEILNKFWRSSADRDIHCSKFSPCRQNNCFFCLFLDWICVALFVPLSLLLASLDFKEKLNWINMERGLCWCRY